MRTRTWYPLATSSTLSRSESGRGPEVSIKESLQEATLTTNPVLAATAWRTNGDMIADCARLGYLKKDWRIFDATYGAKGVFWKRWRPNELVTNDSDPDTPTDHHFDFRDTPFPDGHFDAVIFDPPYVCVGGRTTSGIPEMHDRYGLVDAPKSPEALLEMNLAGLTEMVRITRPGRTLTDGGYLAIKYQDQISSGKYFAGTHYMAQHALDLGCTWIDRLERTQPNSRPQPKHVRQIHARRNLSTLLIFRRGKT